MSFHKKYKKISPWWRFIRQEFELLKAHTEIISITGYDYEDDFVKLNHQGFITVKTGFKWGASSLTVDTKSSRRASLIHDAIFYMSYKGVFQGPFSKDIMHESNSILYHMCLADGMWRWRAKAWFEALELGSSASWESNLKKEE